MTSLMKELRLSLSRVLGKILNSPKQFKTSQQFEFLHLRSNLKNTEAGTGGVL